jgi:hypothetical protein
MKVDQVRTTFRERLADARRVPRRVDARRSALRRVENARSLLTRPARKPARTARTP